MRKSLIVVALICAPFTASAQTTATVQQDAPIYVTSTPAANLAPLRIAAVGTILNVLGQEGEWLRVEFEDPQWGRRVGWVQKQRVRVSDPNLRPMDLSVRDASPSSPQSSVPRGAPPQVPEPATQRPYPASEPRRPLTREGLWFSAGMGVGSLGCENCGSRETGLSGGLSLGGSINDKWLLGVGTTGWAKQVNDELVTVGTLDFRFRFYPVTTQGFFITAGLGLGSVSDSIDSEFGAGAIVGVGWDIRVGRNVSLTPFYNGFAMSNENADANVGQLGLAVTIH
jgi:hypothetical protein